MCHICLSGLTYHISIVMISAVTDWPTYTTDYSVPGSAALRHAFQPSQSLHLNQ